MSRVRGAKPWRARMACASAARAAGDLDDRAQLLGKGGGDDVIHRSQIDAQTAMRGERHLQQRHQQTAIRAVVIGEQPGLDPSISRNAENIALKSCGLSRSGGVPPFFNVDLSPTGAAQAILARA